MVKYEFSQDIEIYDVTLRSHYVIDVITDEQTMLLKSGQGVIHISIALWIIATNLKIVSSFKTLRHSSHTW